MKNGNTVKVSVLEERVNNFVDQNSKEHKEMMDVFINLRDNHLTHLNQRIEKMEAKVYFAAGAIAIIMIAIQFLK